MLMVFCIWKSVYDCIGLRESLLVCTACMVYVFVCSCIQWKSVQYCLCPETPTENPETWYNTYIYKMMVILEYFILNVSAMPLTNSLSRSIFTCTHTSILVYLEHYNIRNLVISNTPMWFNMININLTSQGLCRSVFDCSTSQTVSVLWLSTTFNDPKMIRNFIFDSVLHFRPALME